MKESYYSQNKERIKLKSMERYYRIKDSPDFKDKAKEYHKSYNQLPERRIKNLINGRAWRDRNKEKYNKLIRDWRIKKNIKIKKVYSFKIYARNMAEQNISLKDKICELCNINVANHRHHEDYNNPLEVNFLCSACHGLIHRIPISQSS